MITQDNLNDIIEVALKPDSGLSVLAAIQAADHAAVIFQPDEIGAADPSTLEDLMTERGWAFING